MHIYNPTATHFNLQWPLAHSEGDNRTSTCSNQKAFSEVRLEPFPEPRRGVPIRGQNAQGSNAWNSVCMFLWSKIEAFETLCVRLKLCVYVWSRVCVKLGICLNSVCVCLNLCGKCFENYICALCMFCVLCILNYIYETWDVHIVYVLYLFRKNLAYA